MSEIVETSLGRVRGVLERGVRVFRGIPYGAPVSGEGRWRAPRAAEPWAGVRDAAQPGPAAPQAAGPTLALLGLLPEATAEDCLCLNVWAPADAAVQRPVLVWLHGGGFTSGSGALPVYDGAALARAGGAVVVTANYRLGALGFLYLGELAAREGGAPANFGLLDQIAALAWVRENAAAFGGDPRRVTLFGQSAGAMCAAALLAAPRARGLASRAILQSGAASNVHPTARAERVAAVFFEELGIAPADGRRLRAGIAPADGRRLRAAPLGAVLVAQARAAERLRRELEQPAFQPCVDGELLPRPPLEAFAAGEAAGVPLLVGTNLDEWKFYGLGDPKARALDEAGLLRRFARGLPGADPAGRPWAERVVEAYRAARAGRASVAPPELWFAVQSDRWFRHPAMRLAELHAAFAPAWAYLFDWASPAFGGALGSCHTLEVPFVFGGDPGPRLRPLVGEGPEARALEARMQRAWLAFAHGEAPGGGPLGPWPAYERGLRATMRLGRRCGVEHAPLEAERAFWDGLPIS
jgi:para-nitrobenzyl esterase